MYRPSFAFWYCVFLLVIPSSGKNEEYLKNFTNGDKWSDNSTMPYELNANSMKNQKNETELMHYNSCESSVKNKSETNFMLHKLNEHSNENNDDNLVPYKMCNDTCLHYCNLILDNCYKGNFQDFINNTNFTCVAAIAYSCEVNDIPFDVMDNENAMFIDNSSLKLLCHERLISLLSQCANIFYFNRSTCAVILEQKKYREIYTDIVTAFLTASLLCLLMTFIVYSICPELQNMHGYTLRSYVASMFVAFTILLTVYKHLYAEYPVCVAISLLYYFCYFASLLWQNAICFDILRIFGRVRFLQKNIKQSKRKIFFMSSFYVWGTASIYVIICAIMNFVPTVPNNIQPNICINTPFGFANDAYITYFDIPTSVFIICNICFLIFTMLSIVHATKNIDSFLKDAEDKRQTKQRSMMYLKLFLLADINMGLLRIIKWTSDILFEIFGILEFTPIYVLLKEHRYHIKDIIECLQSFIIFFIFICKKRIMQLLLKQFGCEKLFVKRENIKK